MTNWITFGGLLLALSLASPALGDVTPVYEAESQEKATESHTEYIKNEGAGIYISIDDAEPFDHGHVGGTVEVVYTTSEWSTITTCDGVAYMKSSDLQMEPVKKWRSLGTFKLTYYDPHSCCGTGNGITASGRKAVVGRTIAMSRKYAPLGAHVLINGHEYIVDDRGVTGRTVDVLVNTHSEAKKLGVNYAEVFILEGEKND